MPSALHTTQQATPLHFLVVDDNPTITRLIELQMRRAGYCCETAANGEDALKKINQNVFDLVISDISMPGMSGLELLKSIKIKNPHLPVLIITGHATIENAVEALRLGAINFITKPIRFDEVFETINKVLDLNKRKHALRTSAKYLIQEARHFAIPTGELYVSDFATYLAEPLEHIALVDAACTKSVTMAMYETLTNAVEHGNLELDSALKFRDKGGMTEFKRIKAERLHDPAFALRKVSIQSAITATMAQVTITDEGPGFDYNALIDPTSPDCIDKPHGRGIFLIKQIFDEVRFNHSGNSITLVLRKNSPFTSPKCPP
jgi:DNA-binding response OmpR family regulator